ATEWTVSASASLVVALITDGQAAPLALAPRRLPVPVAAVASALDAFARAEHGAPPLPDQNGHGALVAVLRDPAQALLDELCTLTSYRQGLALLVDAEDSAMDRLASAGWLVAGCASGEAISAMRARTLATWGRQ